MAYVDYTFYIDDYHGTAVAAADFEKLAEEASAVIDYLTFDRAEPIITANTETSLIDKIKRAVCAVMDTTQEIVMSGGTGIVSEAVASYKITYAQSSEKLALRNVRYIRAAKIYLGSSGLLYTGVEEI